MKIKFYVPSKKLKIVKRSLTIHAMHFFICFFSTFILFLNYLKVLNLDYGIYWIVALICIKCVIDQYWYSLKASSDTFYL